MTLMPPMAGGLVGSMGGVASSIGGGFLSNHFAKQAYKRSVKAYKNRYLWTTRDLKRAGLNPILAVSGMSAGGQPSSGMGSMTDLAGGLSKGSQA